MGRKRTWYLFGFVVLLSLVRLYTGGLNFDLTNWLQDFITISGSVIIEATPFVVLGVLLSVLVKFYIPDRWFFRLMPQKPALRRLYVSTLGVLLPVCECGNLPLARGLIMKGLRPSESIAFLLSAPILNPVTITTTIIAFGFDKNIVVARIFGGFVIANFVSWVMHTSKKEKMLTNEFTAICDTGHPSASGKKKTKHAAFDFVHEIGRMMPPLLIGSAVAGLTQVLVPRSVLDGLGSHLVLSVLVMIALAFIVSICANVDAFFALSYAGIFTPGSIVAFLVFGPMIDIKMLSLMRTTFTKTVLLKITLLVFMCSFLLGLGFNYAL